MSGERLKSSKRAGWIIPNGHGGLWTHRVFDTESEANAYVAAYWHERGWAGPMHRPTRALVHLTATIEPRETAHA